jgi:conjugative transfer region protein TrbK
MSRSVKLAAAAALGGLLMAIAIASETRSPVVPTTTVLVADEATSPDPHAAELRRCRTITMPESGCDAVWDAERQRFFHGRDDHR